MSSRDDVFGLIGEKFVIAPGATLAQLVTPQAGECSSILKYFTGGSCELIQAPVGASHTGPSLVPLIGTGYLLGTSETVNIPGAARYYIMATGATVTCYHMIGLSSGF